MESHRTLQTSLAAWLGALVSWCLILAPGPARGAMTTQIVDAQGDVGRYSSTAVDAAGHPRVAYWDMTQSDLKYAWWDGAQWHIEAVPGAGDVGGSCSLAIDGMGRAHVSYFDATRGALAYGLRTGSGWAFETVDAGGVGTGSCIAVDAAGDPRISYVDFTHDDLLYAARDGGGWTIDAVDTALGFGYPPDLYTLLDDHTSLALDSQGRPMIGYIRGVDWFANIRVASKASGDWEVREQDGVYLMGNLGLRPTVAFDPDDHSWLAYVGVPVVMNAVLFAVRDGGTYESVNAIELPYFYESPGWRTSIRVGADGEPRVAFVEVEAPSNTHAFKLARRQAGTWTTEVVEPAGSGHGTFSSLALGPSGEIRLSCFDELAGDLCFHWDPGPVDAGGVLPVRTAIGAPRPNPWDGRGTLSLTVELATPGAVSLSLLDVAGREVAAERRGVLPAGAHALHWAPPVGRSGVWFVKVEAGERTRVLRLAVVR